MKIGVFDSGLGGLFVLKKIIKKLPQYDYVYLGDTKRVPYGNRSQKVIYDFTKEAAEWLFCKNCGLIILLCNTASSQALRRIQKSCLPKKYPKGRVLGVIVPTAEEVIKNKDIKRAGVLATISTVGSRVFEREIKKLNRDIKVFQQAAPLLVPLIENGGMKWSKPILEEYLRPLMKKNIDALILGCTHYPILKNEIGKIAGEKIKIFSQDEIIPSKLSDYLKRHPETDKKLTKKFRRDFFITDITVSFKKNAKKWYGKNIKLKLVNI